jgi:hypothetical protein
MTEDIADDILQTVWALLGYAATEYPPKLGRCDCYDCRVANKTEEMMERINAYLRTKGKTPHSILGVLERDKK